MLHRGTDCRSRTPAELLQRSGLDHDAIANHREAVRETLDLGEDVGGKQHCCSTRLCLPNHLLEYLAHQGVEAAGWFVEDEQLSVGGKCCDDGDLLAVALGVLATTLGRVQLKTFNQFGAATLIEAATQRTEQVDSLTTAL